MGHNCVEDTRVQTPHQQWQHPAVENKWIATEAGVAPCHRTTSALLCPTSAGGLTNQSSGRKHGWAGWCWCQEPRWPRENFTARVAPPFLFCRHNLTAESRQRRVTWPRDMSWRHHVTRRDVTRHSICHKSTHYPPPWPRPTRADRLTDEQTDWQKDQNCIEIYRHSSGGPETRDQGRVGGGTHGGFGSAHVETGHIFDFPVRWQTHCDPSLLPI